MKSVWALGVALLFGASMFLSYPVSTWASEQGMNHNSYPTYTSRIRYPGVSGLRGVAVLDQNGQTLGKVAAVTFDESGGATNFILVSSDLPGMYGKLVAIPYESTAYATTEGAIPNVEGPVVLGVTMKEFKDAPTISFHSWRTDELSHGWSQQAYQYWSNTPYFG